MGSAKYVERGGEIVIAQPLSLSPTTMYSWLVRADLKAVQGVLDVALNKPCAGALEYRAIAPIVCVVAADIARGQSMDAGDRDMGWMPEQDIGFWIPVARGKKQGGEFVATALCWYQPYLFVNNVAALVTGRETFGFHKQGGTCQMPTAADHKSRIAVETLIIKEFGPNSEGGVAELFSLEDEEKPGIIGELEHLWDDAAAAIKTLESGIQGVIGDVLADWVPSWELVKTLIHDLVHGDVPMVFLKQFRDIADAELACYQAIVEAPSKLTKWHGGGFMSPRTLRITQADSHPIVRDLGLAGAEVKTELGFWTKIDFQLRNGKVLWEA